MKVGDLVEIIESSWAQPVGYLVGARGHIVEIERERETRPHYRRAKVSLFVRAGVVEIYVANLRVLTTLDLIAEV